MAGGRKGSKRKAGERKKPGAALSGAPSTISSTKKPQPQRPRASQIALPTGGKTAFPTPSGGRAPGKENGRVKGVHNVSHSKTKITNRRSYEKKTGRMRLRAKRPKETISRLEQERIRSHASINYVSERETGSDYFSTGGKGALCDRCAERGKNALRREEPLVR